MDQKLSKRNDIKDRNEEYAMKNEVLEKKISELQNLNQAYRDKLKNIENNTNDYERLYNDVKCKYTDLDKSNKTLLNSKKDLIHKNKEYEIR